METKAPKKCHSLSERIWLLLATGTVLALSSMTSGCAHVPEIEIRKPSSVKEDKPRIDRAGGRKFYDYSSFRGPFS